jgi:hypothetical protein
LEERRTGMQEDKKTARPEKGKPETGKQIGKKEDM